MPVFLQAQAHSSSFFLFFVNIIFYIKICKHHSPSSDTSGGPLFSPCALEGSPGVTAKFQMFRFQTDYSSSE